MRKKGNTVLAGLIICLLLVFLAAAGKLFGAYLKYQKGDVSYEKLPIPVIFKKNHRSLRKKRRNLRIGI